MRLTLKFPPDTTFLSQVLYEGILYLCKDYATQISLNSISLKDKAFQEAFRDLDHEKLSVMRLNMVGNDTINRKLPQALNIGRLPDKKTFQSLLAFLRNNSFLIPTITRDISIELIVDSSKGWALMDTKDKRGGIAAPQILKADRYTGFTSMEENLVNQQPVSYTHLTLPTN